MRCCCLLFTIAFFVTASQAQSLIIGTYNMRYANADDSANGNGWGQRAPIIESLIQFNNWDVFGTQEMKYNQITDFKSNMPAYHYVGVGRDDGKEAGEYAAIWYKKDKFTLLQSHTFWLSTDTTKPNTAWDAALPRICTWAKFQDVTTGFVFYFFNLHMDHIGVTARRESAKLVLQKIKAMAGKTPVILTGDFNVDQTSESYLLINTSNLLQDVYELAPVKLATNGTFNDFSTVEKSNSRIDHIFISHQFSAQRYAVLTNMYWSAPTAADTAVYTKSNMLAAVPRLPSDHYPVMAEVAYKNTKAN